MPLVLEELQECVADDHSVEQDVEKRCLSDIINTFVISLAETEQKVFVCRYWYMDSVDCKQFGFSESKVKSMLYRTREKLRVILSKEGFQ